MEKAPENRHKLTLSSGHTIDVMSMPVSFIAELETKHTNNLGKIDYVGYAREVLSYPASLDRKLEDFIDIPEEIGMDELKMSTRDENGEKKLQFCLDLSTKASVKGRLEFALLGIEFIKRLQKNIDDYKYQYLEQLGKKVFSQLLPIGDLMVIREFFRSL